MLFPEFLKISRFPLLFHCPFTAHRKPIRLSLKSNIVMRSDLESRGKASDIERRESGARERRCAAQPANHLVWKQRDVLKPANWTFDSDATQSLLGSSKDPCGQSAARLALGSSFCWAIARPFLPLLALSAPNDLRAQSAHGRLPKAMLSTDLIR